MRARPTALVVLAVALAAASGAGCTSIVPYEPDRTVVRSIPREIAKSELRRLLAAAYPQDPSETWVWGNPPLAVLGVDDEGFGFRARTPHGTLFINASDDDYRFVYRSMAPQAFKYEDTRGPIMVSLEGQEDSVVRVDTTDASVASGCIWFQNPEDAEKFMDAVASLKTDGRPAPAAPAARGATCPKCGAGYPATARFCSTDGEKLPAPKTP